MGDQILEVVGVVLIFHPHQQLVAVSMFQRIQYHHFLHQVYPVEHVEQVVL